jgi:hypothetical protein
VEISKCNLLRPLKTTNIGMPPAAAAFKDSTNLCLLVPIS